MNSFNFLSGASLTRKVLCFYLFVVLSNCARAPVKGAHLALRPASAPTIQDDLADFRSDLSQFIEQTPKSFLKQNFKYQKQSWSGLEVLSSYKEMLNFLKSYPTNEQFNAYVKNNFEYHEVYGVKKWGDVFVTSYFEPMYDGSLYKTKKFSRPALKRPKGMIEIKLTEFAKTHPQIAPHFDYILDGDKGPRTLMGRLEDKNVIPYYSRKELANKKHKDSDVIVWLDPVDLFFLQIQGSGTIRLKNGKEFTLTYAAQNGHEYVAIGKFLTDQIPLKEMTAGKIIEYLKTAPEQERIDIINRNPSYIFFNKSQGRPPTSQGTPVIDGRTLASDSYYFPKGLIGYLNLDLSDKESKKELTRLVFNQDSGGAIKGPGRVDLFWGKGPEAGEMAGQIKHRGQLWFLLPKKTN